ncbi:hypothetical protein L1D14_06600 [Vibrio tubiashii]|uniref:hypothetical protein n=1 Tax=Vibrio tubiashii TaxID=29498 RepID=UPI001EFD0D98|nr:hypothetical protein [Vibrio tubiashii]MCG9575910.1 hypothetical protein [Vibrio tubiashii]
MPKDTTTNNKNINTTDVLSSATITSVATFVILTWSKTLSEDSTLAMYMSEQVIAFLAGLTSFLVTIGLSYLRYKVRMKKHKCDYTDKLNAIDDLIKATKCDKTKKDLEQQRNTVIRNAAKAITEESSI